MFNQALLRLLLHRIDHPEVCVITLSGVRKHVSPHEARLLLERGHYKFDERKGRVRWMREVTKPVVWQRSWRNTGAGSVWINLPEAA